MRAVSRIDRRIARRRTVLAGVAFVAEGLALRHRHVIVLVAHGVAPADVEAAIDWHVVAAPSSDGAGPSSNGAGPSSEDAGDIEQPAAATEARRPSASVGAPPLRERRGSSGTVACRV